MEFIGFLDQRYLVIQYAMPVILVFLVFVAVNDDRRKGKKVVPLMILWNYCSLCFMVCCLKL